MSQADFMSFGIEQGLSQNSVYDIAVSDNGHIWLATIDGLNQFNGYSFTLHKPQKDSLKSFGNTFTGLENYNDELLLIATASGVLCFDLELQEFKKLENCFENFVLPTTLPVSDLKYDGTHLIVAQGKFLYRYSLVDKTLNIAKSNTTSTSYFKNIVFDLQGRTFVYTDQSIYQLVDSELIEIEIIAIADRSDVIQDLVFTPYGNLIAFKGQSPYYFESTEKTWILKDQVIAIDAAISCFYWTVDQKLLIGTRDDGLYEYDIRQKHLNSVRRSIGLNSDFVLSIFQDTRDQIIVGTSGGGFAINLDTYRKFEVITPSKFNPEIDGDNMVLGLATNQNDYLFFGGLYSGLKIYDLKNNSLKHYSNPSLQKEAMNMYDFLFDKESSYIASWAGLLKFHYNGTIIRIAAEDPFNNRLYTLTKDDQGLIYAGGVNGLFIYNPIQDALENLNSPDLLIRHMEFINKEELLIASSNKGLVLYNIHTKSFTEFPNLSTFSSSARHFYHQGEIMWIATDNGLMKLDKNFNLIRTWTKNDDLANDFIYAVLKDDLNNTWISTNLGLSRIDGSEQKVSNFSKIDGLQSLEYNTAAALKTSDGKLIFGGTNGFNIVKPADYLDTTKIATPQITGLSVNQKSVNLSLIRENISLPYDSNFIKINYASIDHWTDKVSYWYKLEGLDDDWKKNGKSTQINFAKLNPDDYTLLLKSESEGVFSDVNSRLKITIVPAFWQTLWFKLLVALLSFLLVFFWIRYILSQKNKDLENKKRIMELESKMMKYRMNPHFIFNTLNSLKHHALFKPKDVTGEYITEFSQLVRGILDNNNKDFISLSDDIDWMKSYLHVENKRLRSPIKYEIYVDPKLETSDILVPPLILHPFIENTIWQRLYLRPLDRQLSLQYRLKNNFIEVIICDNGVGTNESRNLSNNGKTSSSNLDIALERIEHFNNLNKYASITYSINDLIEEYSEDIKTTQVIRFPLILNSVNRRD